MFGAADTFVPVGTSGPQGTVTVLAFAVVASLLLALLGAVLPLRAGGGQHSSAGPGATDVWQLRDILTAGSSPNEMAPGGPEWPDEEDHAVAVAAQADAVVSLERRRNRKLRDEPTPYAGRHRAVEVEETLPIVPVELASTALRCGA